MRLDVVFGWVIVAAIVYTAIHAIVYGAGG